MVDYWSHGELGRGILGRDGVNAAPIRTEAEIRQISELVEYLDGLGSAPLTEENYREIARFNRAFGKSSKLGRGSSALRMKPSLGTLEIRALRSQPTADYLARLTRLLDARINYTNSQPASVFSVADIRSRQFTDVGNVEAFKRYVHESGLDFSDYASLVPEELLTLAPFDPCEDAFSTLAEEAR
ncbi:MAG: hypothetical protein HRT45_12495 [Bdellovibrionales bacterium]|nr:hypothetical protein [Bdellovibrionales bacterium]